MPIFQLVLSAHLAFDFFAAAGLLKCLAGRSLFPDSTVEEHSCGLQLLFVRLGI